MAEAAEPHIGLLREGPLHAAVKDLLAAPGDRVEVPVGRFVIDLVRADGELVEVQGTAEGAPFRRDELDALLDLALAGIADLTRMQADALAQPLPARHQGNPVSL